jgi:two-component system sensor histidine kinase BaeS
MIRRNIAVKIGLSIIGLVALDLLALYISIQHLLTRVLRTGDLGRVAPARVEELLLLAAVGAVLLAVGLTVFLSQRLTRPLVRMIAMTQDIARGRYQTRIPTRGNDEVARLGEAINELARHLDRLDTTRKEFLADVGHELRTPLTYMRGYAQVLYDGLAKTPDEVRQYLKIIYEETQRVERLVQDLFVLAQADAGMRNAHREPVDLAELVVQVAERFRPKAGEKGIVLAVQKGAAPTVEVDPARIEQAVFNLLDNALRYTPAGGLVTVNVAAQGDGVEITVQDSGPGIPPEELPYIWDRLYRVDKSRSREHGGTGLGLSIVKHIAELHGGRVTADSRVGSGTTMRLDLPVRHAVAGEKERPS